MNIVCEEIISGICFLLSVGMLLLYFYISKRKIAGKNKFYLFIDGHLNIWMILAIASFMSFLCSIFIKESDMGITIKKPGYSEGEQEIVLQLEKEEEETQIEVNILPKKLPEKEAEQKMEAALLEIKKHMKGKNKDLGHVVSDLDFSLDEEQYPFEAEYKIEPYLLIDDEGVVRNDKASLKELGYGEEDFKKGIPFSIEVILNYGEIEKSENFVGCIFPKQESAIEQAFAKAAEVIKKQEQDARYEESVTFPTNINGVRVTRIDHAGKSPLLIIVLGMVIAVFLLVREAENKKETEKRHLEELRRCYPWFVNELVLLLGAGMQMKNIFAVLIKEYDGGNKNALIQELKIAYHGLEVGMSEDQVYYQLGRRLKLPCYIKLMTILEQNLKKGSKGMRDVMEQEEIHALEERKNLAKKYGEEAETKLLGPMVLLLIIIMLIIMIPAFMSFQ